MICFNPRTREGATQPHCQGLRQGHRFNPRTREGATSGQRKPMPCSVRFNPRTREGATCVECGGIRPCGASIHAPVRVRLSDSDMGHERGGASIHAPVRVRLSAMSGSTVTLSFNPRTREGATGVRHGSVDGRLASIHAPVRVRRIERRASCGWAQLQSTHP